MTAYNLDFLAELDGIAQAELVARGELERSELLNACAARIEACEPSVHAIVSSDLDQARARPPVAGAFGGVPTLLKDLVAYPGLPFRMGSRLFARNMRATPAPFIERVDASGLVVVGKSATSELGMLGSTETLLEGVTHNPWSLAHSAAGSSGGAAAAVAAGIVPLAHASDGGGSVRIPASVCGLFGFKPSRGRTVPVTLGSEFGALVSDHCITRSVRDSALFLSLTEDPNTPLPKLGYVREASQKRLKIAAFTGTASGGEPAPAVRRAFEEACELCTELGHEVRPIDPPELDGAAFGDAFFLIAGAAMAGMVDMIGGLRKVPVAERELEPFTWGLVHAFQQRGAPALAEARATFERVSRRYLVLFADHDVVLTPTLAEEPWLLGHLSPLLPYEELLARMARAVGYTPIHNVCGAPGMSVPLHWTVTNLPIGVHFAANVGAEQTLLALAYELEAARPWRDRWAPFSYPRIVAR